MEQLSNYEFHSTEDTRDLLAGVLFVQKAEGNLLQVDTSSQILRKQKVCETIRPFDGELSKVHEAKVHVFSDSVLCVGKGAMNEPEIKFTDRGNDHVEQYRESARRNHGEKVHLVFHIFLAKRRTRSCQRLMNGFEKVKEKMDKGLFQNFIPGTFSQELKLLSPSMMPLLLFSCKPVTML